jgi:hypothetical protein
MMSESFLVSRCLKRNLANQDARFRNAGFLGKKRSFWARSGVFGQNAVLRQSRCDRPPYEGAYWSHPHYDHYSEGWEMHEGHWDHDGHDKVSGILTANSMRSETDGLAL